GAGFCDPMQITVQPGSCVDDCCGVGDSHGYIGCEPSGGVPLKSISGVRENGSSDGRPMTFIGRLGPSPSGVSSCALPSGGGGPVRGGRSPGPPPVASAAAQPSPFGASAMELL